VVAANKIDKVNRMELEANLNELMSRISDDDPAKVEDHVFPVSAKKGTGLGELKSAIHAKLVAKGYKTPFKMQDY
jgi:GTP-binding protein EngB required for normal cell division